MELSDLAIRLRYMANNLEEKFLRQAMDKITVLAVEKILERTARGEKVGGGSYSPYSEKYLPVRRKHGRPTAPKDFRLTGNLLDNVGRIRWIQNPGWIEIWIGSRGRNKRNRKKGGSTTILNTKLMAYHSQRENSNLMGLTEDDLQDIARKLELDLKRIWDS